MSKNTRIRILLTVCAALLLVVVSVAGTMAWLQDTTDEITNTFDPTKIDIDLTETNAVAGKQSFNLLPGKEYTKDPTVIVKAGSEACWVFVEVIEANDPATYLTYSIDSAWKQVPGTTNVYYQEVAAATADIRLPVLTDSKVTVKADVGGSIAMPADSAKPSMSFKAYAIQSDALSATTAEGAWAIAKPNP